MYSTVPPWLQHGLSLIDALTGAPGMAFPHMRLRSGTLTEAFRTLAPDRFLSENLAGKRLSSSQLFTNQI